jgi:enoyl-CoA hydratase
MILTGRPVPAREALEFGLANRIVGRGEARRAAEQLAAQIAAFPQACMRNDRRSVLSQGGKAEADAMAYEFALGVASVAADGIEGAARFSAGAGRHGEFT